MSRLLQCLLIVWSFSVLGSVPVAAENGTPIPSYVGSESCAGCHEIVMQAWKDSHHAWAWKSPDETTVLGGFGDVSLEHKGVTTRFSTRDGRYYIEAEGSDGRLREFEVQYTAGVEPLQQYLLETEPGRLQAFDLAWDNVGRRNSCSG